MNTKIVIPLFQGAAYIHNCLQSLQEQINLTNVIVVNNGSTDAGPTIVRETFPKVTLIDVPKQLGFAGAVNTGIRAALAEEQRPEVVIALNQDTMADPHWLEGMLVPFDDPTIGLVGSLARFPDGHIQHAGGTLIEPLWYGRNRQALTEDTPLDYLAGLALGMRVAMLEQIGLFDEAFFPAYFEDVDLCLRAKTAGWRIELADSATLVHHEGALTQQGRRHTHIIERQRWRLLLKHRSPDELHQLVFPAEQVQLHERASLGMSDVLRSAYAHALLMLPMIARQRGWSTTDTELIRTKLVALRTDAITIERKTRIAGLQAALQTHLVPVRDLSSAAEQVSSSATVDNSHHLGTDMQLNSHPATQAEPPTTQEVSVPQGKSFTPGKRPPVAIVVLTWNGLAVTQRCFASLRAKTRHVPYRLIVVDNGSTDGTVEWLRDQPDVTLIANSENRGFAAGVNQGIAAAPPDHDVLLLNNDTEIIEETWLDHLRTVANDHPDYGIVGCLLLFPNGLLQHAGTYMPQHNFWGYQIGGGEPFIGQYPGIREVEGVTGACMYIRRDVIETIGGLDETYFSYYEDTDYCLRAMQAGFKVVCTGGAKVIHHENSSTRLNNADWWRMFSHGQRVFLNKWRNYFQRQRYQRGLLWHSLIAHATGYATSSREFVRELDRRGVDVRLACIFGTDYTEPPTRDPRLDQLRNRPKDTSLPQVVYSQGDAFIKNSGRYRIGFTMLESDTLPADWVYQANQMDEVWVPSHFTRDVFMASGVRRPIHVIPLGFNPNYFHPHIQENKPANVFVFLSIFEWIERKAPELLLQAYVSEFTRSDDVVLVLKVFNHDPHFNVQQRIHELTNRSHAPRIVVLLNQEIAEHQMGGLYRSADCFVLPTRGEGWGMPILEAMACGLPVIATDWGAQREFFNDQLGYPLRVRQLIPAVARSPYYAGSRWADPDIDHLRYLMRYIYEHPAEAQAIGLRAASVVHQQWTWGHAVDRIMERLETIDP
ncbi:MAG: glycosyl transferase [Chloroflexus aggregans]|uniref:Glycosyl transferase n=1 Tax=Chloroflexus aggregans TaxID=152260 RepID=A0A2J6X5W4_9CHLR|nr:MAG: glycosyl transferase [Chloroflexus aggregans]